MLIRSATVSPIQNYREPTDTKEYCTSHKDNTVVVVYHAAAAMMMTRQLFRSWLNAMLRTRYSTYTYYSVCLLLNEQRGEDEGKNQAGFEQDKKHIVYGSQEEEKQQ